MLESRVTYVFTKDLLSLFRHKQMDTLDISNLTGIPEHQVVKQLDEHRTAERERTYQRDYQRKLREDWNSDEPY
jgi:hypothetical protein